MSWFARVRRKCRHTIGAATAYAALIGGLIGLTAVAALAVIDAAGRNAAPMFASTPQPAPDRPVETASAVLQSFEWGGSRRSQFGSREYSRQWRGDDRDRDYDRRRQRSVLEELFSDDDDEREAPRYTRRTYRTVCVRLCDGYAWPISFAASESRFEKDSLACASSCDAPAKLYVYRNPGEELEQAVDLRGQPYTKLKTAFLFRTSYNESCRCRPQAWEQVSLDRHKIYAMEQDLRKGKVKDKQDAQRKIAAARSDLRQSEAEARERIQTAANAAYTAVTGQTAPVVAKVERPERRASKWARSWENDEELARLRARSDLERTARSARNAFGAPMALGGADRQAPKAPAGDWTKKVYGGF